LIVASNASRIHRTGTQPRISNSRAEITPEAMAVIGEGEVELLEGNAMGEKDFPRIWKAITEKDSPLVVKPATPVKVEGLKELTQ